MGQQALAVVVLIVLCMDFILERTVAAHGAVLRGSEVAQVAAEGALAGVRELVPRQVGEVAAPARQQCHQRRRR